MTRPLKLQSVPLLNKCLIISFKKKWFSETYAALLKRSLKPFILVTGSPSPYTSIPQLLMGAHW